MRAVRQRSTLCVGLYGLQLDQDCGCGFGGGLLEERAGRVC